MFRNIAMSSHGPYSLPVFQNEALGASWARRGMSESSFKKKSNCTGTAMYRSVRMMIDMTARLTFLSFESDKKYSESSELYKFREKNTYAFSLCLECMTGLFYFRKLFQFKSV